MGKGRAPCCDKSQVKKGPWSPAEDLRLISFIQKNGHDNWRALPKQAGLLRCGKSCRLRWINYLRPDVKRGNFTKEEEDTIIKLHQTLGNKWSKIASHLPGRTDNEIKNVWNTHLKKRLPLQDSNIDIIKDESKESSITTSSSSSSSTTIMSCHKRNDHDRDDHDLDDEWNHDAVTKTVRVSVDIPEAKESPTLSNNLSDDISNVTNYNATNTQVVDGSNLEVEMESLFNFSEPYDIVQNTLELEVNKPEIINQEMAVEIPFESELDFWNMLDGLNISLSITNNIENNSCQRSNITGDHLGDEYKGEVDNKKWLRYLETELGLEDATANDPASDKAALDDFQYEMPMKPANNPGTGYYHLWPSI